MSKDSLRRFIFENQQVRGAWVALDQSIDALYANQQQYPETVRQQLNQYLVACVLLASVLKFNGRVSLHAQGDGSVSRLWSEVYGSIAAQSALHLRGIARLAPGQHQWPSIDVEDSIALLGKAQLVVSLEPEQGQRYQSFIELAQPRLEDNLGAYFAQSEQLPTLFKIAASPHQASALMLQRLPGSDARNAAQDEEFWRYCTQLCATIKKEELLELEDETLLYRLFHEQSVRLFDPQPISFACSCSRERTAQTLQSIGREEVLDMLKDMERIEMQCQFCGRDYLFDFQQATALFELPSSDKLN